MVRAAPGRRPRFGAREPLRSSVRWTAQKSFCLLPAEVANVIVSLAGLPHVSHTNIVFSKGTSKRRQALT